MGYMDKNKHRFWLLRMAILLIAVTVLMFAGIACAENMDVTAEIRLAYGGSLTLAKDSLPAEAVWSSDQPEVVSVDETGMLTANSFGAANITCTVGGETEFSVRIIVTVPEEAQFVEEWEIDETGIPHQCIPQEDEAEISAASLAEESEEDGVISAASTLTARQKVDLLAKECIAAGMKGEYEIALWMHDWLIYNANYDYSYREYGPEGVLLRGTGVCQSYALAYELMLDRMGIENIVLISRDMNHAWNLVKIEGEWYHVDCTWDDPGTGGMETHEYFCLNDRLMSRDHLWVTSDYPACTSLACYYPIRNGENCAESEEAAKRLLVELVEERTKEIKVNYVGDDSSFSMWTYVKTWFVANAKNYGVTGFSMSGNAKRVTATVNYGTKKQGVHLKTPVTAPDFELNSLNGYYRLANYKNNGLVLIFGQRDCPNTLNLLDNMEGKVDGLAKKGVEVLVSISGAQEPEDLIDMMVNGAALNYVCWQNKLMESCLSAVGVSAAKASYPAMFVINSAGKITYYSLGYVINKKEVTDEAYAVGTGKALPQPDGNAYSQGTAGTGNINDISADAAQPLQALTAGSDLVMYVMDNTLNNDVRTILAGYERNAALYKGLNIRMAVSLSNGADTSADYPNVERIQYDSSLFWKLMYSAGFRSGQSAYSGSCFLIDSTGNIIDYVNGYDNPPDLYSEAIDMVENRSCNFCMPAAMSSIDDEAFECSAFGWVDLTGTQISSIGSRAFADCAGLKLIKIPDTVETIAAAAFEGSENVVIFCSEGSTAHTYAEENGILCLAK